MVNVVDSSCLSQFKVQMNFLTELVFLKKKKTTTTTDEYLFTLSYYFINTIKLFMD